jgi:hypothetical protein
MTSCHPRSGRRRRQRRRHNEGYGEGGNGHPKASTSGRREGRAGSAIELMEVIDYIVAGHDDGAMLAFLDGQG